MASSPLMPPQRHIPYRKEGWGAAIVTVVLTAAVFLGAWAIHARTYREPTDVMMRQRGDQPATHAEAGHGGSAPAGGGAGGAEHGATGGAAHGATPTPGAPATGTPGTTH